MESEVLFRLAADLILITHVLFVMFVIFGLLSILAGKLLSWVWVRNPWFRLVHLAAIGYVVLETWLGVICPLTIWEMALRERAGDVIYPGSFVAHWLDELLYYHLPAWVFIVCYTIFGALVAATWFWVRPRSFAKPKGS